MQLQFKIKPNPRLLKIGFSYRLSPLTYFVCNLMYSN